VLTHAPRQVASWLSFEVGQGYEKRICIALATLVIAYYAIGGALYLSGFRIYRIPSSAMEPTIRKDEMVIGRLSEPYKDRVERFDIVVYRLPNAPGEIYAKRVAAMSGEHVVINKEGMSVGGQGTT
jgi:signal peptidase I